MSTCLAASMEKFLEQANLALERKDLIEFVANISKAEMVTNSTESAGTVNFLKVKGYLKLNQFKKVLELTPDVLDNFTIEDSLKVQNYQGVALGFSGELDKAKEIFLGIVDKITEKEFLVEVYLNLFWITCTKYKIEAIGSLDEMKNYIEVAHNHFNDVSKNTKGKILDNYSVYYHLTGKYTEAINFGEKALTYFNEYDLPKSYNNLVAMYLDLDEEEGGISLPVEDYMEKAEIIGERYNNNLELGKTFFNKAMYELKEEQLFSALDTLYLSFEYFKKAEALTWAFDCLVKILQLINDYKVDRLKSFGETLKNDLKGTVLYDKL